MTMKSTFSRKTAKITRPVSSGKINITINDPDGSRGYSDYSDYLMLTVTEEDFIKEVLALNIEGLTYTPAIKVPTKVGAVVRHKQSTADWVRGFDGTWFHYRDGSKFDDHTVQSWLTSGEYEVISEGVDA